MMSPVILLSMLMTLPLYSKCDQASDLWQQLELELYNFQKTKKQMC